MIVIATTAAIDDHNRPFSRKFEKLNAEINFFHHCFITNHTPTSKYVTAK